MTLFISDGPITHVTAPAFHDDQLHSFIHDFTKITPDGTHRWSEVVGVVIDREVEPPTYAIISTSYHTYPNNQQSIWYEWHTKDDESPLTFTNLDEACDYARRVCGNFSPNKDTP